MQLQLATLLIICLGRFFEVVAQGMPITPCPKIFQYRFDGSEWFGLMAIHSPESHHPLHLRVTLSMRGKPTTVSCFGSGTHTTCSLGLNHFHFNRTTWARSNCSHAGSSPATLQCYTRSVFRSTTFLLRCSLFQPTTRSFALGQEVCIKKN